MVLRRVRLPSRLVMLGAFGGTSILNYAFGLIMGWMLLPGDFGWLAFAQTILLVAGLVLQTGFPWSLAREVASVEGSRRGALVRGSLAANLALAGLLGAALLVLFASGPLKPGLETGAVAVIVALSLPFISLAATARGYVQGLERFGLVAALHITDVSCKFFGGVALVLLGFGVAGAVTGFLVGGVLGTMLGFRFLSRDLGVRFRGRLELPNLRVVGPMFGALFGLSLLLNMDLAALKLLSDERELAGYYQAGIVLANAPYYLVMQALVPVFFVQLARLKDIPTTQKSMGETLGLVLVLVLPLEIVLMIVPEQALVALFPDYYASGAPVLRLLAIGNTLLILTGIFSAAFQAIGRAKVPALVLMAVTLVEPFAMLAVVPTWEATGAALIFIAATFFSLLLLGTVYLREVGVQAVRRAASWFSRYIFATGVGVLTGYAAYDVGVGNNSAVVVGATCYFAVALLALRLLGLPAPLKAKWQAFRKTAMLRKG